jgi:uncharacterized membrane protein
MRRQATPSLRSEHGLIGKVTAIWLIVLAILLVFAWDAGTIVITRFQLSDVAQTAASVGAATFKRTDEVRGACAAVAVTVEKERPGQKVGAKGCRVDTAEQTVTVVLKQTVSTLLLGRIGPAEKYTKVTVKETASPPVL